MTSSRGNGVSIAFKSKRKHQAEICVVPKMKEACLILVHFLPIIPRNRARQYRIRGIFMLLVGKAAALPLRFAVSRKLKAKLNLSNNTVMASPNFNTQVQKF